MMPQTMASRQLLLLWAVSCLCNTSQGFVQRPGLSDQRQLVSLAAVQVDPRRKSERQKVLPDLMGASASQLNELIHRTPRDLNVLQEIAGHIEVLCDADEDIKGSSEDTRQEQANDEEVAKSSDEAAAQERRKLAHRAALLGSRSAQRKPPSSRAKSRTATSVGAKRVGSASRARQGPGVTKRIMDAVRKSASSNKPKEDNDNSQATDNPTSASSITTSTPLSRKLTPAGIHSAVLELMERQRKDYTVANPAGTVQSHWNQPPQLLQPPYEQLFSRTPPPGTVLVHPCTEYTNKRESKLQFPDCLTARVVHGLQAQDTEVAHLRLSVFSDFSPEVRRQLVSRSVEAVVTRRMKGATCLVATVPPSIAARRRNRPPVILGSAECSFHEFEGTMLGRRRPADSILYVTEVAVSPLARRRGIGKKLLEAIDVLANMRGVETLYLHVDVENVSALSLYEKAGFQLVDRSEPMFLEFTTKLNLHDGATKGRNHFLLYKDMVQCPTWLPEPVTTQQQQQVSMLEFHRPAAGTLGFEIPC